jgi:hypothetical protein
LEIGSYAQAMGFVVWIPMQLLPDAFATPDFMEVHVIRLQQQRIARVMELVHH